MSDITKENKIRHVAFGVRLGAYMIDSLILLPLNVLAILDLMLWKSIPLFVFLNVIVLIYKPLMEWKYGATIGKILTKIRVVKMNYKPINLQDAFNRYIFFFANSFSGFIASLLLFYKTGFDKVISLDKLTEMQASNDNILDSALLILVFVSCTFISMDLQRQALHDKLAKTFVVNSEDLKR